MIHIETKALEIESLLEYAFTDKCIAVEAVQMAAPQIACIYNNTWTGLNNNKRLSVLGDAVLAKAQWTELRNDSLSNDALARRGCQARLDRYVITADSNPAVSRKMVATTLQAVIGGVYQDGGDEAVQRVMQSLGFFDHALLTIPVQLALESATRGNIKFPQRKVGASFYFSLRLRLHKET